ncbi:MarR family winged helix-turn-helix transcriptional regulator [Geomonas sp.]|uniref:MarR family winged helix-turn-helix transcriptional regulator n=1 Tax=Geomonas sp. TaxID=2651584 RepID=UPI002B473ACC|nr:MarR family transcriptional regulator [Geomonas sp.]HJV34039.1 MarR family transcriptional regulator [Geomonas sp.]
MGDASCKVAEIIDNIRRVFQVVNEQSKLAERETGITGPQLWAIKAIAEGAPINGAELARRMYLHPTTIVGIIDRLEVHGLVLKTRSKTDRRMIEVELTEQGKELLTNAPEVAQGMLIRGLERLPEEKLQKIWDGLEELVLMLGARDVAPQLLLSSELNVPKTENKRGLDVK